MHLHITSKPVSHQFKKKGKKKFHKQYNYKDIFLISACLYVSYCNKAKMASHGVIFVSEILLNAITWRIKQRSIESGCKFPSRF